MNSEQINLFIKSVYRNPALCYQPLVKARDNPKELKARIKAIPDLNYRDKYGKTILLFAVLKQDVKVVEALIDEGADVNIRDNDGMTVLMYAAQGGDIEILETLIDSPPVKSLNL